MRFARLAAFAAWVVVALLAVAGFAAFSPNPTPSTTATTEVRSASSNWGATSGRVVAYALTSGLRSVPDTVPPGDIDVLKALMADRGAFQDTESETVADGPTRTSAPARPPTTTTVSPVDPATTPVTEPPALPATTTTTLAPRSGILAEQDARAIIALFFAPADVERAVDVAYCESRWNPAARNPESGASGLFQQIPRYWEERSGAAGWAGADIFEAHANAAVSAWLVYEGGGWGHWAASRACWS